MAVTAANSAPYAPGSTIVDFIDRFRNRGLAKPFTPEVLARAGVSDSLIPRTYQALQTLELINEEGNPTETLEALRRAKEPEFKGQMAAWINRVYADVLSFVNASDDETAIRDAFRAYNPVGQQSRMVSLFMSLCRAAGLREDDQSNASPRLRARKPTGASTPTAAVRKVAPTPEKQVPLTASLNGIPAPISGLLAKLPPEHGTWTSADRDKFKRAFDAMLEFCYTVSENKQAEESGDD